MVLSVQYDHKVKSLIQAQPHVPEEDCTSSLKLGKYLLNFVISRFSGMCNYNSLKTSSFN